MNMYLIALLDLKSTRGNHHSRERERERECMQFSLLPIVHYSCEAHIYRYACVFVIIFRVCLSNCTTARNIPKKRVLISSLFAVL